MNNKLLLDYLNTLASHELPTWDKLPEVDLYMNQVQMYLAKLALDDVPLTQSMINNYVKAQVVSAPTNKMYSKEQIASFIMIMYLKKNLKLNDIKTLSNEIQYTEPNYEAFRNIEEEARDKAQSTITNALSSCLNDEDYFKLAVSLVLTSSLYQNLAIQIVKQFADKQNQEKEKANVESQQETKDYKSKDIKSKDNKTKKK